MSLNLDVVIETPDHSIDMKSGLDTLKGTSDATRIIVESVLTDNVPKKSNHNSKVRSNLKQSFKGSYGHNFSIDIYDNKILERYKSIGKDTIVELISFFMAESVYANTPALSKDANTILNRLGDKSQEIVNQLRITALGNIHKITNNFNYEVKLRHHEDRFKRKELSRFNSETASTLATTTGQEKVNLTVSITRLNIHTGNGRFQVKDENETVAFGFSSYKLIAYKAKKVFSNNLSYNNGLEQEDWEYLDITARPVQLKSGKIVKYLIVGL